MGVHDLASVREGSLCLSLSVRSIVYARVIVVGSVNLASSRSHSLLSRPARLFSVPCLIVQVRPPAVYDLGGRGIYSILPAVHVALCYHMILVSAPINFGASCRFGLLCRSLDACLGRPVPARRAVTDR